MSESPTSLAYDAATHALARQSDSLDALRTRASTLIAAAAIATSFLGAQALREPGMRGKRAAETAGVEGWEWVGLGGFLALAVAVIVVLLPWPNWVFTFSAKEIIRDYAEGVSPATLEQTRRDLALHADRHHRNNQTKLNRLYWAFRIGCGFLTVEVVAWIIDLTGG